MHTHITVDRLRSLISRRRNRCDYYLLGFLCIGFSPCFPNFYFIPPYWCLHSIHPDTHSPCHISRDVISHTQHTFPSFASTFSPTPDFPLQFFSVHFSLVSSYYKLRWISVRCCIHACFASTSEQVVLLFRNNYIFIQSMYNESKHI